MKEYDYSTPGGDLAKQIDNDIYEAVKNAAELTRAKQALHNAVQQASMWAQEARTQKAALHGVMHELGLPAHDWEAVTLVRSAIAQIKVAAGPLEEARRRIQDELLSLACQQRNSAPACACCHGKTAPPGALDCCWLCLGSGKDYPC